MLTRRAERESDLRAPAVRFEASYQNERLPCTDDLSAMPLARAVADRREEILRLAAQHGARNVRVFGSAARGELTPESDVDFLVDLEPDRSLFDLGGLLVDLQGLLGREVDVATEQGIHEYIRSQVLKEAHPL